MKVESISIASPTPLVVAGKTITTGLYKQPVEASIRVTALGLDGDNIINQSVHGGIDQAVYIYRSEDYDWWTEVLGVPLQPGLFGENLKIRGLGDTDWRIGDRLQINDVILELSAPRLPCLNFAVKMNDSTFVKKFVKARKSGAYARVIQEGEINTGDAVEYIATSEDYPTIEAVFVESHAKVHSAELLAKALASPVSILQKPNLQKWYDKLAPAT